MTALSTRDSIRDAATAAAAAAARTLPLPAEVDAPVDEGSAADLLPEPGTGRAVSLNVRGDASGTLVLVVADSLAAALENSPFGEQKLVDALGPALGDAGAALQQLCGDAISLEAPHEVQADVALAGVGDGRLFSAVPLRSAGEHVATLALLLEPVTAPGVAGAIPQPREVDEPRGHEFQSLTGAAPSGLASRSLDLLHDVEMGVTAELGRTRMTVRDLLSLAPGAVVELDRAAGSPVDVLVNGTLIARGEVVVIDEEFGIRISEILGNPSLPDAKKR
jgi:flagellar motor switch protein FliN/FliY